MSSEVACASTFDRKNAGMSDYFECVPEGPHEDPEPRQTWKDRDTVEWKQDYQNLVIQVGSLATASTSDSSPKKARMLHSSFKDLGLVQPDSKPATLGSAFNTLLGIAIDAEPSVPKIYPFVAAKLAKQLHAARINRNNEFLHL